MNIIGVAGRDEIEAAQDFVEATGVGDFQHIFDADGSIWTGYGVFLQPSTAFINQDGTIELFTLAMGEEGLTATIEALIAK